MIAILGGFGAALVFATATLCSARSSRMIGASSVLAWVMIVGSLVTVPAVIVEGRPAGLDRGSLGWLALAGAGNVLGLLLAYSGLRIGKVGLVAPIVSTEGAIAALFSVAAGENLAPGAGATLGVIAVGIVLAALTRQGDDDLARRDDRRAVLYAVGAAFAFGASLYATARVSADLPVVWALLPARIVGVVAIALPLVLSARLRLTRRALPLVVVSGLCEIAGFGLFALASRHGVAVSAVLASQFAAIAAIIAYFLFRERLERIQIAGVAAIIMGVAALTVLQA
jgi:drug/metabolite transporter (DMT)-like permease